MRFAHISDMHLGFQSTEELQRIERGVFERCINECIARKVDFVIMAGDMFHANIPSMAVQRFAFSQMRRLHDADIPVYAVYGSHDFSPVADSVIDLLAEIGYIKKVTITKDAGKLVSLGFLTDERTGAKLAGLSGLKTGRDREYYDRLDRKSLEAESGFKIFVFHGGIAEMKSIPEGDYMPLSLLPKGFSYYAGGHLHKFTHGKYPGYAHVVYPGTPFMGHSADLEENAKGQRRGIVIVEFEDTIKSIELVEIPGIKCTMINVDAEGKSAESVKSMIHEKITAADVNKSAVLLKVHGQISSGRTAEVDLPGARAELASAGAVSVSVARSLLTSKEYAVAGTPGKSREEIEKNIMAKGDRGGPGEVRAKRLLHGLRQPQLENETNKTYQDRILRGALEALGLNDDT